MKCRRCTECPTAPHHWIESMFATDDDEWQPGDYGCKHCDARGVMCPLCGGDGKPFVDDPDYEDGFCVECDGWGVIEMNAAMIGEAEKERSEQLHAENPPPHYFQ